jgi:rieske iron-sulfur protein
MTTRPERVDCSGGHAPQIDPPRRRVIRIAAAGLVVPWSLQARAVGPLRVGDLLVEDDAVGDPVPLKVADLSPGKPVLAWPFDPERRLRRDTDRLAKVLLIRLEVDEMAPQTRERSALGVLPYSAICTHQGCDVKTWLAKERRLVCYCHTSKFALLDDGMVTSGPATRALPALALTLEGDRLAIAAPFTTPPGGIPV